MTSTKINTLVWLALVSLIIISYYFTETSFQNASIWIAVLSIVKFTLVGFQFMEAKKAHLIWQLLIIFFASIYLIATISFY